MNANRLSIAIPASVVSDTPHLREKTSKIGLMGRAAAIFRVNEIVIYPDYPKINQSKDMSLIELLLKYIETPQYLRKRLFELRPELQFVGILPPLRTHHHPLEKRKSDVKEGEYREGVAISKTRDGTLIDIGLDQPALLERENVQLNNRLTVRIADIDDRIQVELADRGKIQEYWGYTVQASKQPFPKFLEKGRYDLTIATSRYGPGFSRIRHAIAEKWGQARSILIAFGSPAQGLHRITEKQGIKLENTVDFIINAVPNQGTETLRTEEALIASLAILAISIAER